MAIGAAVGFVGGLFGFGGALIATPLLTTGFGFSQHTSQGTAVVMALASVSTTLATYARNRLLPVHEGLFMAACSTVMGIVASQLVRYVPDEALHRGFGIFLIALAALVRFGHLGEDDRPAALSTAAQVGIGSLAGALSGFFVVGGALVSVPLLERAAQYSQQRAQAMVLLMIVPASVIGLISYASARYVRWGAALALGAGAAAVAPLGARTALAMKAAAAQAPVRAGAGGGGRASRGW